MPTHTSLNYDTPATHVVDLVRRAEEARQAYVSALDAIIVAADCGNDDEAIALKWAEEQIYDVEYSYPPENPADDMRPQVCRSWTRTWRIFTPPKPVAWGGRV